MHTYECILAVVLMTAPKEQTDLPELHDWLHAMRPTMLASRRRRNPRPRELSFFLSPAAIRSATDDAPLPHGRLRRHPAPFGRGRLPDRKAITDYIAFKRVSQRSDDKAGWECMPKNAQCDRRHRSIAFGVDAVREARCDYYYVTVRRQRCGSFEN
ncbi:MAG: hypothetical protein U0744_05245 [Gemmataceae bacterium]